MHLTATTCGDRLVRVTGALEVHVLPTGGAPPAAVTVALGDALVESQSRTAASPTGPLPSFAWTVKVTCWPVVRLPGEAIVEPVLKV